MSAAPGPADRSVGELLTDVTRDLTVLVRQELTLARLELRQEARRSVRATAMFGAAGVAAGLTALFVSLALWAGLRHAMDPAWAALVVAAVWAAVTAATYSAGRSGFRRLHAAPEQTVDTLSQVPDALRGRRGGTS